MDDRILSAMMTRDACAQVADAVAAAAEDQFECPLCGSRNFGGACDPDGRMLTWQCHDGCGAVFSDRLKCFVKSSERKAAEVIAGSIRLMPLQIVHSTATCAPDVPVTVWVGTDVERVLYDLGRLSDEQRAQVFRQAEERWCYFGSPAAKKEPK